MHCSDCAHSVGPCRDCFAFSNYEPESVFTFKNGSGIAVGKLKEPNVTTKEINMTNTYITVDGKTYKTIGGTMKIGGCGDYCEIEVETVMTPCNEVSMTPEIKDIIFNPPATIVFWSDNTKTVVKALEGDIYDPEKGIAMAISKKMLGNKYDYYHAFAHYLKKWDKQQATED